MNDLAPIQPTQANSLMEVIARAASDPNCDVTKLEKLWAISERLQAKEAEREFNAAMTKAQGEVRAVAADASNSQTHSKYASYHALDRAMRPIYTKYGFALSFDTGDITGDAVRVLCYVSHDGGHTRTYKVDMPADGKGARGNDVMTKTHAAGSALSYGQRYLLRCIFNIAIGDDDDGNGASAPVGSGLLSAAQSAEIRKLIADTGADLEKFCAYMKIGAIVDLTVRDYDRAVAALMAKGAKNAT